MGVLDYFRDASDFVEPPSKSYRKTREVIKALYNNQDVEYNSRILVRRLQRIEKNISAEGRDMFKKFIPEGDINTFASHLLKQLKEEWNDTMKILTDRHMRTNAEGVYAIGDVDCGDPKLIVVAAAEGAIAAKDGYAYIKRPYWA